MLMEFVGTLDEEKQSQITTEYDFYAKSCIRKKETPLNPEQWLSTKQDIVKEKTEKEAKIRLAFRKLMVENDHGEFMERVLFFVGK